MRIFYRMPTRLVLACLLSMPGVLADSAVPGPQETAGPSMIVVRHMDTHDIAADGSETRDLEVVTQVLRESALKSMSVLNFAYASEFERLEVEYVRVRKPDGTLVISPPENIQDVAVAGPAQAPVFSDARQKHVAVKSLGLGDTLEFHVRWHTRKAMIPGQCSVASFVPDTEVVKESVLQVTLPAERAFLVEAGGLEPEVTVAGGRRSLRWTRSNPVPRTPAPRAPWTGAPAPQILLTTFRSWDEVGAWYRSLEQPQEEVTPSIRAKAAELTKGLTQEVDRVRALYEFVATRIHYVGLSFGMGRFQPHSAADVLSNGFGDCKDKHTLLATMLKAAGLEAWPALMRASGDIDSRVPAVGQLDHLVTVVPLGRGLLWLDTTPGVGPFGYLGINLRDRPALLIPPRGTAELTRTPRTLPYPFETHYTFQGKMEADGRIHGKCALDLRGDMEVGFRQVFQNLEQHRWQEFIGKVAAPLGLGFEITEIRPSDSDATRKPFQVTYEASRQDSGDWGRSRMLVPLLATGLEAFLAASSRPGDPMFLPGPESVYTAQARVKLPPGNQPRVPAPVFLSCRFADYRAEYAIDHGVLTVNRQLRMRGGVVDPADRKEFLNFVGGVSDDETRYVVFGTGSGTDVSQEPPDAIDRFNRAVEAQERKDWASARMGFQQVLEISPRFPGAHFGRAISHLMLNDVDAGIRDLLKEEEIHPELANAYLYLGRVYEWKGRRSDAISQLRLAVAKDPENHESVSELVGLLQKEKRFREATEVLEARLARDPDNAGDLLDLGLNQARTGETDRAEATLSKVARLGMGPEGKVKSAAALMDAGSNSPMLRTWIQEAAASLDEASRTLEDPVSGLANTALLGDAWVLLGRLKLRDGNAQEALHYFKAAWSLRHTASSGMALAQGYERSGRRKEAAEAYELAAVADPSRAAEIELKFHKLTGRTMVNGGGHFYVNGKAQPSPLDRLVEQRTLRFKCPRGRGTVSVVLVASAGGIENVHVQAGAAALEGCADASKGVKLRVEWPDPTPRRVFIKGGMQFEGEKGIFIATGE